LICTLDVADVNLGHLFSLFTFMCQVHSLDVLHYVQDMQSGNQNATLIHVAENMPVSSLLPFYLRIFESNS
jgi:hypothetical protein